MDPSYTPRRCLRVVDGFDVVNVSNSSWLRRKLPILNFAAANSSTWMAVVAVPNSVAEAQLIVRST